jgi:prepilin-type N-terminal cleavage/methylation domain-containing protein
MKKNIEQYGYTLIELLAVMMVFVVIGTFIVSILVTSLRSNNKTNALTTVRQNGGFVIAQLSKTIREAHAVISPYPCGTLATPATASAITIATVTGDQITYSCTGSNIASNGANLLDNTSVTLQSCSFSCGKVSLANAPVVSINFSLSAKTISKFSDFSASSSALPFETSVVLRNTNL